MIAYIEGDLMSILDESIIVDVQGIGYEIFCPNPFIFSNYEKQRLKVFTYMHVREDLQVLYGFKNEDEKYLFMKLISVSGIGPKSALAMMGSVNIPDFVAAIEREDDKFLTSFPGIGKKTSRQIILDLKGKLISLLSTNEQTVEQQESQSHHAENIRETQEALKALGYKDNEIKRVLPILQKEENEHTDVLIRKALALLTK